MKKSFIAAGAALLATAFVGQTVSAKSLEDVLKEKGVITEADYKEVTKTKPINYKLGKGFTFTSADEKFQLTLGGRLQLRYTFTDYDKGILGTKQDTSQFDAAKARIILGGYAYSKDLTYALEIDGRAYGKDAKQGLILAYANYKLMDEAEIRLGQFKDCFGRSEVTSDANLEFVDRSPVANAFKHGYDIGAMLHGKVAKGLAYYNVGVFGGAGQTNTRESNDNAFFARVAVNPLGDMAYSEGDLDVSKKPLVSIGANYLRNTVNKTNTAADPAKYTLASTSYDSTANYVSKWVSGAGAATGKDKLDVDEYGVDAAFKWMGLFVTGEYLLGQAEPQSNGKLKRAHGFFAQAGYMVLPKLEVAFRYSYLDPDRDTPNNNQTEQIGSVSYYFEKHNLKLQADVANLHDQAAKDRGNVDDMQYRLQAQIVF